jgi:hypothetical protein
VFEHRRVPLHHGFFFGLPPSLPLRREASALRFERTDPLHARQKQLMGTPCILHLGLTSIGHPYNPTC